VCQGVILTGRATGMPLSALPCGMAEKLMVSQSGQNVPILKDESVNLRLKIIKVFIWHVDQTKAPSNSLHFCDGYIEVRSRVTGFH
jgi:hypothetical protein